MGKKKTNDGPGKVLIRDRFSKKTPNRTKDSFLHTSELDDGFEWGRLNLQSVTESNQLDEFLATAELAGQEFTAEKANIQILTGPTEASVPTEAELQLISDAQLAHKSALRIPRRPGWHNGMSADELAAQERRHFIEWRRKLAVLQETDHILVTPFERNLECWRQLWRVIERSDIVLQIVDSRDPLMFRCEDLEAYVKEVKKSKVNIILINKSDLLTQKQRDYWANYFNEHQIHVLFWSAKLESEKYKDESVEEDNESQKESGEDDDDEEEETTLNDDDDVRPGQGTSDGENEPALTVENISKSPEKRGACAASPAAPSTATLETEYLNSGQLCDADRLLAELRRLAPKRSQHHTKNVLTIGLVGYPNVGKSSTINAILQAKKCKVSATPGKTKHFQTIFIDKKTMLCDCPGLVMPSFANTKAEMILNGILPIDQMRNHKPATRLLCSRIPRANLEAVYSINIRKPVEGENPHRPPTDLELLNAYGAMRGFMTPSGVPDNPKASRILLKDYVNGKLLYSRPPPNVPEEDYKLTPFLKPKLKAGGQVVESPKDEVLIDNSAGSAFDKQFFHQRVVGYHTNNNKATRDRHSGKHRKKEKSRRVYAHLDKHDAY